jgi:hypothetical protein
MSTAARAADEIVGQVALYPCPAALAEWRDATTPLMWAYVVSRDLPAKTVIAILKILWWCPFTFCLPPDFFGAIVAFCDVSEADVEEFIEQPASFFGTHFTYDFESVPGAALNLARQAGGKLGTEDLMAALDLAPSGGSLRVVAQIAHRLVSEGLGDRIFAWLGADVPDEMFSASLLYLACESELAGFSEIAGHLFIGMLKLGQKKSPNDPDSQLSLRSLHGFRPILRGNLDRIALPGGHAVRCC